MYKSAERYLDLLRKERKLYTDNHVSIARVNRSLLNWMLLIASAISVVLTAFCFFMDGYGSLKITYVTLSALFLTVLIVQKYIPDRLILFTFYGLYITTMGYASYSAAVLFPDSIGVFALGIMIVMPTLILDKSPRITGITLAMMAGYLLFVIPMKHSDQREDEIVYIVTFALAGLMMGSYMRWVRLENLELLRQSLIRETTDMLTGLYNRRRLFDYFIKCEADQAGTPVTGISILDIDYFKTYNDTYGHLAGDNCLRAVGACLLEYAKEHDVEFYRYGGEEFVAISHERDAGRLIQCFEGIVTSIAALKIPHEGKNEGIITMSQGVYLLANNDDEAAPVLPETYSEEREGNHLRGFSAQQYLSKADAALYQAKEQGRNKTVLFSPAMLKTYQS